MNVFMILSLNGRYTSCNAFNPMQTSYYFSFFHNVEVTMKEPISLKMSKG